MDNIQTILRFFTDQKATIGYSVMALLTIGGQKLFTLFAFQCPCNHSQNFSYGLTFLLGPAAVLLVLSLVFSNRLWRLYTGCCLNPMKLCPRGNCFHCCTVLITSVTGAFIAPVMWLCVALLNGMFYECAVSGVDNNWVVNLFCKNKTAQCRDELAYAPCDQTSSEKRDLMLMLRAQSQILGWCIIIIASTLALCATCYKNCRSQVSYLQMTFWKRYIEKENANFDTYAVEYATKLADRNLKSFFENKAPDSFPFPNHEAWEEISALYTFSSSEQYYSTLQRYVERSDRDFSPDTRPLLELDHSKDVA